MADDVAELHFEPFSRRTRGKARAHYLLAAGEGREGTATVRPGDQKPATHPDDVAVTVRNDRNSAIGAIMDIVRPQAAKMRLKHR